MHSKQGRSYHIDGLKRFMFVFAARQNSHPGNDNMEMNLVVICSLHLLEGVEPVV